MSDRTGHALGTLSPVIYFENAKGRIVLAGYDTGKPEQARKVYEGRFRGLGYDWREAGTLAEVDRLQTRLADQIRREQEPGLERIARDREATRAYTASEIRRRMVSADTSAWERDFLEAYQRCREDKKDKYQQSFDHRRMYLNIRENSESTQFQDLAPDQPGDFWRGDAQQK